MRTITFVGKFTCAKTHMYIIQSLTSTMREAKGGLCCHRSITVSALCANWNYVYASTPNRILIHLNPNQAYKHVCMPFFAAVYWLS